MSTVHCFHGRKVQRSSAVHAGSATGAASSSAAVRLTKVRVIGQLSLDHS
jgi:hypothetical protein